MELAQNATCHLDGTHINYGKSLILTRDPLALLLFGDEEVRIFYFYLKVFFTD